jgi:hypothetical protein
MAAALLPSLPLGAATPAERNLAETIGRLENLRVETSSSTVSDLRLTSGHLTVLCKSGSASLVRAGDEVVGLFFRGNGALEYQTLDTIEFPLTSFNVRKNTGLSVDRTEKSLTIRDDLTEVLWLSSGRPLPPIGSPGSGSTLAGSLEIHREKFGHVRGRPASHIMAAAMLNVPAAPVAVVEVDGGKEDFLYVCDEVEDRAETLFALRGSQSRDPQVKKNLYRTVLSNQPIGRDRRDPNPPRFFLTDVRLELEASDGKDVKLTVVETVVPQKERLGVFRFDLHNTVYDVIGNGALQPRTYRVREVADEAGHALSFHHQNGEIMVALPAPAEPDHPVKLRFRIEGDFLIRPGGDNFWALGVEPWFPQPDLGAQFYTFHSTVKVPRPFLPFASGKTIGRREEGSLNVLETEIDKPVSGVIVVAGKYDSQEEIRNGVTIRVATYAGKNTRAMKQLTDLAATIIEYYEQFLGPFPFPELDILEINDWGFGQAPPGVMFITKEAFNPLSTEMNQLYSQGINERFAHEIAHQYWAYVVKMPSFEEQWLEESFAEYSAALFLRQFKGKGTYNNLVSHWKARANFATDAAPIPLANLVTLPNDPVTRFAIRTGLIYDKGAYLLATLHKELGDDTFLTFLKSYQKSFRWKFGSTKTVVGLLQYLTKKDYAPFFEANFWGTGMPAY